MGLNGALGELSGELNLFFERREDRGFSFFEKMGVVAPKFFKKALGVFNPKGGGCSLPKGTSR